MVMVMVMVMVDVSDMLKGMRKTSLRGSYTNKYLIPYLTFLTLPFPFPRLQNLEKYHITLKNTPQKCG